MGPGSAGLGASPEAGSSSQLQKRGPARKWRDMTMPSSHTARSFVMEPGDIIITGTPPGVGLGMKPPVFLKEGDVVTLGIQGLGEQRQKVVRGKY